MFKVIGVREEKYIGQTVSGHNCNFEYNDTELTKHVVCGMFMNAQNGKYNLYEVYLSKEYGICGSGWTTATWGSLKVKKVKKFKGYNLIPKDPNLHIDFDPTDYCSDEANELFTVNHTCGDFYYPSGWYSIEGSILKKSSRYKSKRPVFVFQGPSAIGKTTLASKFNDNVRIFETDGYDKLPNKIIADVIVLGNKHNYTKQDLLNRIDQSKVQLVFCGFKE